MSKTLLLADDSITIQKVVGLSFASEDVTVISVDNGDDAITRTKEERPDVVLADVVMPGKNGYEVCEAIKADPALAHIPVLLLTGTFEAFDEERAQSVGAAGHVAKPFEAQALVDQVKRLFDAIQPAQQSVATQHPEAQESGSIDDDAFDFFDDEPVANASDSLMTDDNSEVDRPIPNDDSPFEFGSDESSSLDSPASAAAAPALAAEPSTAVAEDATIFGNGVVTGADLEIEHASLTSAEALLEPKQNPDDSLAPKPSASSDEAFDFSFEASTSESSAGTAPDIDPLDGIDPLESVGVEDLAQATVLDPRGASGHDVSFSDLGPAADCDSVPEQASNANPPRSATLEPDATVLAPEFQIEDKTGNDLLEAELIESDSQRPKPLAPENDKFEPVAVVATRENPEPVVSAEPLVDLEPTDQPRALPPEVAASAQSVLENIEPQLRAQIHDTLEKIAWESFGNLTEEIIKQAVERVEAIAWEVVPKLAEALIQEEIRRMKGTPPKDD